MSTHGFFLTMAMLALCSHAAAVGAGSPQLLDFTTGSTPAPSAESYYLGAFHGTPNGVEPMGMDANQIYVASIVKGKDPGPLQVGDVILGINGVLLTGNVVRTFRAALAAAPGHDKRGTLRVLRCRNGIRETVDYCTVMVAPDLTAGTNRYAVDRWFTWCLGPTGMRGWIFKDEKNCYLDRYTSVAPWQILVTSVGTGTPANGIIQVDDVILGAQAGGGTVAAFTNDTRVELGNVITAAEAGDGTIRLLINRDGVGSNQTYTITTAIKYMSYSATAPYNCPKSALILSNALKVLNQGTIAHSEALALLASGNPAYLTNQVMAYARGIAPTNYVASWPSYWGPESTWDMGFRATFLAEYYMVTNDPQVVNGLVQRATMLAKSDSQYGCYGHSGAIVRPYHVNAGIHGLGSGYGPVNAAGLVCNLGVALGKRTGLQGVVTNAEVQPALDRARQFHGYYVHKGTVMYGEMAPGGGHIGANGKNSLAGLMFAALGGCPTQVHYFSRISVAEWADLEHGHSGSGWGKLWRPLGANLGGTNAAAALFAASRWYFELTRRCNDSFSYDCLGDTPETCSGYWDNESYQGFLNPTAWNAMFLAVLKRTLIITGRNADPTNTLDAAAISNAMWAAAYPINMKSYTTNQLISHFSEYDAPVRQWAAQELAKRPGSNALVAGLAALATNANPWVRETACNALGQIKVSTAIPALAGRMYDTDVWVRHRANEALKAFGASTSTQLTNMLNAFTLYAVADPITGGINWAGDPCGWGNSYLADVLFNALAISTMGQPTNILYPALNAGLRQPEGYGAGCMRTVLDSYFTWPHVKALAPALMATAIKLFQANYMGGLGCQENALNLLARNRVEDAIPLFIMAQGARTYGMGPSLNVCITNLKVYGSAASNTVTSLLTWSNYYATAGSSADVARVTSTIGVIVNDMTPRAVTNFKTFASMVASPGVITLPATTSALSTFVTDLDGNAPKYTWRKLSGPGTVTFSGTNNVLAASNCTATFSAPGTYVLQASVSDSVINSSNWWVCTTISWFDTFQMWTNDYGSVTSNVTVMVNEAQ